MPRPLITLTTDFGMQDHFVAVMKGVMLGICPEAHLIDVSHEVRPFEISEGAFTVAETYPFYPAGTVHLVVVDPGVGSARRPILLEAAGQSFVGPDNGVFGMVMEREPAYVTRVLSNTKYHRPDSSTTFHGRDIFAPVAAHLAAGVKAEEIGELIEDALRPTSLTPSQTSRRTWVGTVLKVDRFGNLITNLHVRDFGELLKRGFVLSIGMQSFDELSPTFAAVPFGEPLLIVGSSGFLEVCANQGSAAKLLGCGAGSPVDVTIAKG